MVASNGFDPDQVVVEAEQLGRSLPRDVSTGAWISGRVVDVALWCYAELPMLERSFRSHPNAPNVALRNQTDLFPSRCKKFVLGRPTGSGGGLLGGSDRRQRRAIDSCAVS